MVNFWILLDSPGNLGQLEKNRIDLESVFFLLFQEDLFGQHKTPEPGGMSVQFFRDFYKLDASHVRTRDYEIMHTMIADYQVSFKTIKVL